MKKTLKYIKSRLLLVIAAFMLQVPSLQAQLIDKIVAVVGEKAILLSDVDGQTLQIQSQSGIADSNLRCSVLEDMILQKLLLNQAEKDSVTVSDEQVDGELNKKIRYFVAQMGSVDRLEAYLGKPLLQIKNDYREKIREQLIVMQMQNKITGDVSVSPAEVRRFFESLPADSIPLVESEIQIAQILKKPPVNDAERQRVKSELLDIKRRIEEGRSFASMAAFYSEDPGTASKGGELGFINRGEMVPEFEAAAFALKNSKEISDIVETTYGFHIIQLIERRGETINVRHILMAPKPSASDLEKARISLDSIAQAIRLGRISFEEAALKYSDDADTKHNGGIMINPASGSTWFQVSQMDQQLFFSVDKLKIGEITEAIPVRMGEKREAYRILSVKARTEPHRANLEQDYQLIRNAAQNEKRERLIREWIARKRNSFFVKIDPEFASCIFETNWTAK